MAFGALLGQEASGGGGKRVCRFTVGTSTAGWTVNDCDYLCDGTDDQVEINAAIQALPSNGGEVVILDGTYNITATIVINKNNIMLSGNGNSTILKRMWNAGDNTTDLNTRPVIVVSATNGGCCITKLSIDGNKNIYSAEFNYGICLNSSGNNIITGNTCNNNSAYAFYLNSSNNNAFTGNVCNNNNSGFESSFSNNNVFIGNTCNDNNKNGIKLTLGNYNKFIGNTCNNNNYGIYLDNRSYNTITGNTCYNNSYGISLNSSNNNAVTGNTCRNNIYGIQLISSDNNAVTGNTCYNNDYGIRLNSSTNNTVTGNTYIRGTGTSPDYTSSQYTIQVMAGSSNNLIVGNNIMGKNYADSGTNNTWANNKYN